MSEQPTGDCQAPTIGEQLPAIQSLAALASTFSALPAAYIVVSGVCLDRFDLQVETPADFEVWREALQVAPEAVEFHSYGGGSWLELRTVFHGTRVHVTGHGLYVGVEVAKVSPTEDANWQDDAVPPLAAAGPVAPVEVRTLADMPGGAM